MSSGLFLRSRYQASYGAGTNVHPIRVQEETIEADIAGTSNDPPVAVVNNPISAQISRTKRSRGLKPRYVVIQLPATGQPAGYKPSGITRIPALTSAFFALAVQGTVINYLGVACTVVSRENEEAD